MAEFKANCTRLLREVEQGGEPITVTVRGRPVAVVSPTDETDQATQSAIGFLKNDKYRFEWNPEAPATGLEDWKALK